MELTIEQRFHNYKKLLAKNGNVITSFELKGKASSTGYVECDSIILFPDEIFFSNIQSFQQYFLPVEKLYKQYFGSLSIIAHPESYFGQVHWALLNAPAGFENEFKRFIYSKGLVEYYHLFKYLIADLMNLKAESFLEDQSGMDKTYVKKRIADQKDFRAEVLVLKKIYANMFPPIMIHPEGLEDPTKPFMTSMGGKDLESITFNFILKGVPEKLQVSNQTLMTQFLGTNEFPKLMNESFHAYEEMLNEEIPNFRNYYTYLRRKIALKIYQFLIEKTRLALTDDSIIYAELYRIIIEIFELAHFPFIDSYTGKPFINEMDKINQVKSWFNHKLKS